MEGTIRDVREGFRQWRRSPVTTAAVLASLALGVGANLALFSLVAAGTARRHGPAGHDGTATSRGSA